MTQSEEPVLSGCRAFFWPVHGYELKKLVPMLVMFFLVSLNYNILRTAKDALVVTAKASGAEVIPFIKVWVMLPMAVVMAFVFTHLSNRFSRERVFYLMVSGFLLYFILFVGVVYPLHDVFHPHHFADWLQQVLPSGCKGLIALIRYWTFISFYVMSELWGATVLFLLFWGFVNEVTRLEEAKRFYGLFGVGANVSGVIAGLTSILLCRVGHQLVLPIGVDAWHRSLILLILLVCLSGLVTMVIFRWMHTSVLTDPRYYSPSGSVSQMTPMKEKMSMRQNFGYLFKSKHLLNITIIVVAYNVVINLVEVVWKHQLRELCPNPNDYSTYMNMVTTTTGILATMIAFLGTGNLLRRVGWTWTALIAPFTLFVTSILFFGSFFLKGYLSSSPFLLSIFGLSPLALTVFFGAVQNSISRSVKYTLFDATTELAFVPLGSEVKLKGKTAIDGVCSRLGKSGGAVIHQGLLLTFSTVTACAPYIAVMLLLVISLWAKATWALGRRFDTLAKRQHSEEETVESVFTDQHSIISEPQTC